MKSNEALGFRIRMHRGWDDFVEPTLHLSLRLVGNARMGGA